MVENLARRERILADGYPAAGTGFDRMVLDGLGTAKERGRRDRLFLVA